MELEALDVRQLLVHPREELGVAVAGAHAGLTRRGGQRRCAVVIQGQGHPLDSGRLVAVNAGTSRVLSSGPQGLRVLCVGGVPGGAYERPDWASVLSADALKMRRTPHVLGRRCP